jgi:hypothetical protein
MLITARHNRPKLVGSAVGIFVPSSRTGMTGIPRINDPKDFVRMESQAATASCSMANRLAHVEPKSPVGSHVSVDKWRQCQDVKADLQQVERQMVSSWFSNSSGPRVGDVSQW